MVRQAVIYSTHLKRARGCILATGFLLVSLLLAGSCAADSLSEQQQLEQQLAALMSANQPAISAAANSQGPTTGSGGGGELSNASPTQQRSRSPRSIGDMFKKLFNANKRSKSQQSNSREWDQLQQQQQAAFQTQQQQQAAFQNQMVASSLAAAAANQHAVYASPFATYASSYSPYSGAGLLAWPSSSLAQALRAGTPTSLLGGAGAAPSAGSLYAAASQPYTAYAAPPPGIAAAAAAAAAANSLSQQQQPMVAASHQHISAIPAPPAHQAHHHHQPAGSQSSIDFHQVLDALVRTSGFAPAGDQEAAAAQSYGAKEGTPVFSFKKLVSLPFYLSTDEKSLDTLAPAAHQNGYSLHSMPIMRRHVRRMSTPSHLSQQHQHQLSQQMQLGNLAGASFQTEPSGQSEREQQLRYSSYFNALNNQLASMTANNQLMQYLTRQQNQPSIASQVEAFAADAALANYQASQPFKSSPSQSRSSIQQQQQQQQQMAMAASTVVPMAVAAPQSLLGPPKEAGEREFQTLLSSIQMPAAAASSPVGAATMMDTSGGPFYAPNGSSSTELMAARFGPQSMVGTAPQYYWPARGDSSVFSAPMNGANNGNSAGLSQRDYLSLMGSPQAGSMMQPAANLLGVASSQQAPQNNAMLLQEQQQSMAASASGGITQSQSQPAVEQQQQAVSNSQQQSAMSTQSQQQQQQPQSLVPQGTQRDGTGAASSAGFTQTSAQIEGQQK